jgi:hypothetical protein
MIGWPSIGALQGPEAGQLALGDHVGLTHHLGSQAAKGDELAQAARRESQAGPSLGQRQEPHGLQKPSFLGLCDDHLEDLALAAGDARPDFFVHQGVVALAVFDGEAVKDYRAAVMSAPTYMRDEMRSKFFVDLTVSLECLKPVPPHNGG